MKAYKISAILLLALVLCIAMIACTPSDESKQPIIDTLPVLHYAVGANLTEEVLKADIAKILNISEKTAFGVAGTVDFSTSGKYTLTCEGKSFKQEVAVWVYDNFVNATVDGKEFTGEAVHLNYNKAAASNNFTTCISFTDSLGNALPFTKDSKCMSFEDRAGSYLMYYNVTDAAGQTFSVRVIYDVTYEHYISAANGVALSFEDSATFAADFDGATDVWLEDANGKIDAAYYEIKEDSILLKKEYYGAFVGKRIAITVCSENGGTHFYVTVYDKEHYDEYMKRKFESLISYQSDYAKFQWVDEAPDGVEFECGYHYTKAAGPTVNQTALVFKTLGKYGRLSFDLYVQSSVNTAGNKDMEFQIVNGAKFVSVVDADGETIPVVDKNGKPHVVLTTGKAYHIVLDINESLLPSFYIWGGRTVDLYYYNFELGEPEYTYVVDNVKKSIVCYKGGEEYGYFAWPTVTKLDGKRLIAVSSGLRKAHIDIEGKLVGWYSEDEGKTWSEPQVLADTVLDDRDAGVVYWDGKIVVSWFCASKVYYINNNRDKYTQWAAGIDDELDTKLMGGNYIISEDGGKTWSEIYSMPEGMFTPHGLIVNPEGGLTSVGYLKYDKENKRWGTGIAVRTTDGTMNEDGFVWSDPIVIADSDTQYSWDFQEPYGIYNDQGVLIVVMRADKGLYQCELYPNAAKFTEWHKIAFVQEAPAHMIQHSSGVMIMTYGYRGLYVDPITGKTISYTERKNDSTLGIRARLSYDGGITWTRELILTSGMAVATNDNTSDWGYTSSVELSNGEILTLYYQRAGNETQASIHQVVWSLPEAFTGEVSLTLVNGMNSLADDGLLINTVTGQVGESIEVADPVKSGYVFEGWYLDCACTIPFMGDTYSQDLTLYAKWVK